MSSAAEPRTVSPSALLDTAIEVVKSAGQHALTNYSRRREWVERAQHDVKLQLDMECQKIGADIIALSTNWPNEGIRTPAIVPPARSLENHLFFVAANRVGSENGCGFCGRSSICGPDGVVLASSDDDTEIMLLARIDPSAARNKQIERAAGSHRIDRFADRRPEFYGPIVDEN